MEQILRFRLPILLRSHSAKSFKICWSTSFSFLHSEMHTHKLNYFTVQPRKGGYRGECATDHNTHAPMTNENGSGLGTEYEWLPSLIS